VIAIFVAVAIALAAVAIALIAAIIIALATLPIALFVASSMLSPLSSQLLPLLACHPHRCSHCFRRHCPHNHHLIAVSKRWAIVTAATIAALRATVLGDCGGGSSNEDGCRNSRGKDDGNGGNGVGDNHPCCPCHARFITAKLLPMPLPMLLPLPSYLSASDEEGDGEGGKSNGNEDGNGNEEGNGGRRQQERWQQQ
jgi:hypothetical protein